MRIDELVRSIVSLFQANAEEQQVTLGYEVKSEIELSGTTVSALRDSLSNLLLNAIQATSAGGGISISAQTDSDFLLVSVQDSGPGIANELRQRIWEPFFTTKQRGTGLGLAIVSKRMQEASGSASLAPTSNGAGARFELRVPLKACANVT